MHSSRSRSPQNRTISFCFSEPQTTPSIAMMAGVTVAVTGMVIAEEVLEAAIKLHF
jgi:hypothetical protein